MWSYRYGSRSSIIYREITHGLRTSYGLSSRTFVSYHSLLGGRSRRTIRPWIWGTAIVLSPLVGWLAYHKEDNPILLTLSGIKRFSKTAMVVALLMSDYEWTLFRTRSMSSLEQADALCHTHQRTADRLLWLFRQQGGVYIKAGQYMSSLTYLLPTEYIKTLAVLQDDAPQSSLAEVEQVFLQELGKSHTEM
jgi:hypothetical protein